jgi:hypothetical protein
MTAKLIATSAVFAGLALAAPATASAETWIYGPYHGPYGGRAGAVIYQNPVTGNVHAVWGAQGPYGNWVVNRGAVYHGPCGTAWSRVHRGPNGVVIRRGAVGNGAC